MRKETITYTDYNGIERKEDFYFNLTKAELTEMQFGTTGGFKNMVERIISTQDVPELVKLFKQVIFQSYGVRSDDGRRFMKKDANGRLLAEEFAETEAYSILWMSLLEDEKKAADFINDILPNMDNASSIPAPASR